MSYFDDVVKFHREGGYRYEGPSRPLPGSLSPYVLDRVKGALFIATEGEGNSDELTLRVRLILEELSEYLQAVIDGDLVAQLDALVDLTYVVVGAADHHGFDFDAAWQIVHAANMTKVEGPDRPAFREDGKILKPEDWVGPEAALQTIVQIGRPTSNLPGEVVEAELLPPEEEDEDGGEENEGGDGGLYSW